MSYRPFFLVLFLLAFTHCTSSDPAVEEKAESPAVEAAPPPSEAEALIRAAVDANGLAGMDTMTVSFRFRDKMYRYERNGGHYAYARWWTDEKTGEEFRDVLTNAGLKRSINGEETPLPDTTAAKYGRSVNSVIYFAFMPWALLDPAARPVYRGRDTIRGEELDLLYVSFAEENGGKDSGDLFHYWFTPDTRRLKYLAYVEPGDKAPRFREAYNERTVDGIVVRDYRNYTTADKGPAPLESLGPAYDRGELKLLSVIDLEEVVVER